LAAALKKEPNTDVQLVNGDDGEFTVSVDGNVVARKNGVMPTVEDLVKKVKEAGATASAHA
jgi:hypothetical protein